MTQVIFPLLTALALSAIAAFYSVIGLAQIFPGSFWPIIIMGAVLEVAKLVTVSWLYNNWKATTRALKYYFLTAIVLLMLITSMGIFGYLSKAHLESNVTLGANTVQLRTVEAQEKIARERLNYLLKQASDPEKITPRVDRDIRATQAELKKLSEQKLPLMAEENKLAAEIGPIKYIAEMFYDKDDPSFIDKAVRSVIITIIIVFDPLAILLLIAAQQSYRKLKPHQKQINWPRFTRKEEKPLDKQPDDDVPFKPYLDTTSNEIIPKNKITKMDGGTF
jgi:ABC-type multidrug transport system fused ATPase/permease subunit